MSFSDIILCHPDCPPKWNYKKRPKTRILYITHIPLHVNVDFFAAKKVDRLPYFFVVAYFFAYRKTLLSLD